MTDGQTLRGVIIFLNKSESDGHEDEQKESEEGRLFLIDGVKDETIVDISCGETFAALLCESGRVYTLGGNRRGQLGHGHEEAVNTPTLVADDGSVFSCGRNCCGELGLNDVTDRSLPTRVSLPGHVVYVAGGSHHCAALTARDEVFVWGSNTSGQLGLAIRRPSPYQPQHSYVTDVLTPTRLRFQHGKVKTVTIGAQHTAILTVDGLLYAFGANTHNQLGIEGSTGSPTPRVVSVGRRVASVVCGLQYMVAVTDGGEVWGWGSTGQGQLGLGDHLNNTPMKPVTALQGHVVIQVACGWSHTAFLTDRAEVFTCGRGADGQLGRLGSRENMHTPTLMSLSHGYRVKQVACGESYTMLLAENER